MIDELRPEALGGRGVPLSESLFLPSGPFLLVRGDVLQVPKEPGVPLVKLGFQRIDRGGLLIPDRVDRNHDARLESVGLFEIVLRVKEDRVLFQCRDVRAKAWHNDHERGVLNENPRVTVVGVVIVGPVSDHDVGLPLADQPGDRPAILQGWHEFAIVDVENLGRDAEDLVRLDHLGGPPSR